jgi:anthranilate phosphoribosyltransferase
LIEIKARVEASSLCSARIQGSGKGSRAPMLRAKRVAGSGELPAGAPPAETRGDDHPFAGFVRTVGRGPTLSRSLDQVEAARAMAMILRGEVEAEQLGAFLVVLRYRGETPQELAGFVRAARRRLEVPPGLEADLDWPSYADRHKQLPYFILAALLLAEQGVKVAMHGLAGAGPVTTPKVLAALGVAPSPSFRAADRALRAGKFAYLPLDSLCPPLAALFGLRPVLGVRSAANSFARELNPLDAPCQLQGVFHPSYLPLHQETAGLLGQPHAAILKGGAGEVQRNPEKPCRVALSAAGAPSQESWPALLPATRHAWRKEPLDPAGVVALWRGERRAPAAEAAVTGTLALALKLLGRAQTQGEAQALAEALWRDRPKAKFGG